MQTAKPTPLWLHVARIAMLVVVAAGVAWVVASVQRRANRALKERQVVVDDVSLPESLPADVVSEYPDFAEIESEIVLLEPPGILFVPVGLAAPEVSVSSADGMPAVPDLKLELDPDLSGFLPVVSPTGFRDPYIGSSKSMVFDPSTFGPARREKRHGKP